MALRAKPPRPGIHIENGFLSNLCLPSCKLSEHVPMVKQSAMHTMMRTIVAIGQFF